MMAFMLPPAIGAPMALPSAGEIWGDNLGKSKDSGASCVNEQLNRLRAALAEAQNRLIEAEADLADQLAEINAFEFEFEARVGHLMDSLATVEREIQLYNERIRTLRNKEIFGAAFVPVEDQYRRAWEAPPNWAPTPPAEPLPPASEAEIKKLYRQLARRFHPDLAIDEADRTRRTQKMQAVNDAYAARSMPELLALAAEPEFGLGGDRPYQTQAQLIEALQKELSRCQNRLREIEKELRGLRFKPSVELSLEVKAARIKGRDLLAEMAAQLERKIARKTIERDMLRAQFDQLGPDQGIIPIKR